jgi:3-methyladenine DNA glycosylase/8-oxoguanine DNA glycosylase
MQVTIPTDRSFNVKRTMISHGWSELVPFEFDQDSWTLTRVIDLGNGNAAPVTIRITGTRRELKVTTTARLSKRAERTIVADVRHMFRLDDDMGSFYRAMSLEPEFAWISQEGAGRMLRAPTVFEDLVKMICTTNCSWAMTDKMVSSLVESLGRESKDGRRTFPTPEAMALMPLRFYANEVRAGYRAAYLKELAERVASGELDVTDWLSSELPTAELVKKIKTVKGVGNYAAENLLKLVGRYDGLALDSWTRAKFSRLRNNGLLASDKKIERFYSRFNSWRGLALWCDLTRDWLQEGTATRG